MLLNIHAENPQARLIAQACAVLRNGGVAIFPTDSTYAVGCCLDQKDAFERIRQLRQLPKSYLMTLMCKDISEVTNYGKFGNSAFRLMKNHTPGAFTFIMQAGRDVPKRLQNGTRKTVGIRIPDNNIAQALLESLGEPLLSISLFGNDDDFLEHDEMIDTYIKRVDVIIDGGACGLESTTIVDVQGSEPEVLREGKGQLD